MNYIESEEQYQAAMARIEELLPIVKEDGLGLHGSVKSIFQN